MVYDKVSPMIPITTKNSKINGFVVKIPQNLINYYLFLIKIYNKLQKKKIVKTQKQLVVCTNYFLI